jgi:hypothetical protein
VIELHVLNRLFQYVKQEELKATESGREARATRLITERASGRIGRMAFELARARPRKVSWKSAHYLLISMFIYARSSISPSYTNQMFFPSPMGSSAKPFVQFPNKKLAAMMM